MQKNRIYFFIMLSIILFACGRNSAYLLPPQSWNNTEFMVEIRPGKPKKGMNEFVIISTQTDGVPGYNYIINIKTNLNEHFSQMIQDGHSGVYRRAIELKDPENEVLVVQIEHKKDEKLKTEMQFPVARHL